MEKPNISKKEVMKHQAKVSRKQQLKELLASRGISDSGRAVTIFSFDHAERKVAHQTNRALAGLVAFIDGTSSDYQMKGGSLLTPEILEAANVLKNACIERLEFYIDEEGNPVD